MSKEIDTYYAEWDKCYCNGHLYALVLVPTKKTAYLLHSHDSIESDLFESGLHCKLALTRNRDIGKDIGTTQLNAIVNRQGLFLPDEDLPIVSFPLRLVQIYLV